MFTRNELLDKLISVLKDEQHLCYGVWCDRATGTPWEKSYQHLVYDSLEKEIEELEKQYD